MPNFTVTLLVSFLVILIALLLLGVGWLLTGKPRINSGSCGRALNPKKESQCGDSLSCSFCEKKDEKK